jgi:aspartyl-tRNA(Asn)/glutamyl-tRNA(Gln) amidotransferase subunit A
MIDSALDIAKQIRTGARTAVAVLGETRARIAARDPFLNCFTATTFERAEREAAAIDARRLRGESLPPLAGVPYAVKNLFDIAGMTTLAGAKVNAENRVAEADARLVARMHDAGAILVGALNMDEHAYGFTCENTHYGATRNPHDTTRVSGGRRGGSGTAVAGFGHQRFDPRAGLVLRRVRPEADLWPIVAHRMLSVRRQSRPCRAIGRHRGRSCREL